MNKTFKTLTLTIIFSILSLLLASTVFAATKVNSRDILINSAQLSANTAGIDITEGTSLSLADRLGLIINYLFGLLGAVFLTIVIAGGITWLTAGGNEEKVAKAKKRITNGVMGVVIIFLAYGIVYFVLFALSQAAGIK